MKIDKITPFVKERFNIGTNEELEALNCLLSKKRPFESVAERLFFIII